MSSNDFAIRISNISKCYQIYDAPRERLKQFVMPRLQRLTGRPLRQYYREFWALKNVSFEVKKGETVGIIGRNGSGKSTLLQIICGTLSPTYGTVEVNGRIAALLELGSGFNPEFSGRENVYLNATLLGLSKEEIDRRFDDIVSFADIGDFIEQPVKSYSSGMYVRLAFAVIAHADADVLIIDEALAVGDVFFVQKCMRFLRKFMQKGTVLFVSHDTASVINLCEAAVWLNQGHSQMYGSPKEVADKYLQALYESQQGESNIDSVKITNEPVMHAGESRDMRLAFINNTSHRNDLELFQFNLESASFGKGGGTITAVHLLDEHDKPLTWVVGGERVKLFIQCRANIDLVSPIIGFFVKDRLGQTLFGDNTFLTYLKNPLRIAKEQTFAARFDFVMPVLPVGDYSFTVAIAEGTQQDHIQHHWVADALLLKSHSSSISTGLVGIPMNDISIDIK